MKKKWLHILQHFSGKLYKAHGVISGILLVTSWAHFEEINEY
jgi:hypothetical protein